MVNKRLITLIAVLFTLVALQACNQKSEQVTEYQKTINFDGINPPPGDNFKEQEKAPVTTLPKDETTKQISYTEPNQDYNTQDKRMILRSGTMSMEVDKYDESETKVKQIVNSLNGYLTNSTSTVNASGKKQGSLTIRVAANKFDEMLAALEGAGKVVNQSINGQDVTEEYMDADARLKTQRELESRLLKLLVEKTASLTSVVEVEQKLASVREQIERTEGRMRYLKDRASYSTLTVSIYEPSLLQTSSGGGFFYELGESVKRGLKGFTNVISGIITIIIAGSPVLAIAGLIIYLIIRFARKRKLAKA